MLDCDYDMGEKSIIEEKQIGQTFKNVQGFSIRNDTVGNETYMPTDEVSYDTIIIYS